MASRRRRRYRRARRGPHGGATPKLVSRSRFLGIPQLAGMPLSGPPQLGDRTARHDIRAQPTRLARDVLTHTRGPSKRCVLHRRRRNPLRAARRRHNLPPSYGRSECTRRTNLSRSSPCARPRTWPRCSNRSARTPALSPRTRSTRRPRDARPHPRDLLHR